MEQAVKNPHYRVFPQTSGRFALVLICLLILNGCANFNGTRFEKALGGKTNLVKFSYQIAEDLVESALPPLVPMHPDMPVIVTTFVSNSDLEKTSSFGRLLQENISSRLVQMGYTVKEIKLASHLFIEPQSGETILSRKLDEINPEQTSQGVVVGTFTRTNRVLYLSARLINPGNSNILSSKDYKIVMDDDMLAMFGLKRQQIEGIMVNEPSQPFLNKIL